MAGSRGNPEPMRPMTALRASARRHAERLAGQAPLGVSVLVTLVVMTGLILSLDLFATQAHRVVKLLVAAIAFAGILAMPDLGLLVFPIIVPILPWLPPTPIPGINPLNLLLFSMLAVFLVGRILTRRPFGRPMAMGPTLLLLTVLCVLSIVRGAVAPVGATYDASFTGLALFRSAMAFVPYVIVLLMVETPSWYRRAVVGVLLGALLEALITVKWGRNGSGGRAIGSIGQSNDLGAYLALFSVMAFALLAIPRATRTWWLALGTALLTAYGTVLSLSRGSLVALAAGLVVVAWRTWRPSRLPSPVCSCSIRRSSQVRTWRRLACGSCARACRS